MDIGSVGLADARPLALRWASGWMLLVGLVRRRAWWMTGMRLGLPVIGIAPEGPALPGGLSPARREGRAGRGVGLIPLEIVIATPAPPIACTRSAIGWRPLSSACLADAVTTPTPSAPPPCPATPPCQTGYRARRCGAGLGVRGGLGTVDHHEPAPRRGLIDRPRVIEHRCVLRVLACRHTTPTPVLRLRHETRAKRVEFDIPAYREEMPVLLDGEPLEASLVEVTPPGDAATRVLMVSLQDHRWETQVS